MANGFGSGFPGFSDFDYGQPLGEDPLAKYLRKPKDFSGGGQAPSWFPQSALDLVSGGEPSRMSARPLEMPESEPDPLAKYLRKPGTSTTESQPNILERGLGAVGSVLGAPKSAVDYLARASARHLFGLPVSDTATTGEMLRSGLGLRPEETPSIGGRLAGRAIETIGDIATDPLAVGALGAGSIARGLGASIPAALRAEQVASGLFAGTAGLGALQEGKRAIETLGREGLSPQAAEELLGTGISAGFAGMAGRHFKTLGEQARAARVAGLEPAATAAEPAPPEAVRPEPTPAEPGLPETWEGPTPRGFETLRPEDIALGAEPATLAVPEPEALPAPGEPPALTLPPPPPERRSPERLAGSFEEWHSRLQSLAPERRQAELENLHKTAYEDSLTKLPNRSAFVLADTHPDNAGRQRVSWDIEGLKWANDNLGHDAGDKVLKAVADAMRDEGLPSYRVGGDEFWSLADTPEAAQAHIAAVNRRLSDATIIVEGPDGQRQTYKGIRAWAAPGTDIPGAERGLLAVKEDAVRSGLRAGRGERPSSLLEVPAEGEPGGRGEAPAAPTPEVVPEAPPPEAAAPPLSELPSTETQPVPIIAPSARRPAGGLPETAAATRFAVAPAAPTSAEPTRSSPLGFYSRLSQAAEKIPQPMKGDDMLRYLADPKRGVKVDELKWTGLDDFLRGKAKVTPQEVRDFVRQNQVGVEEVTKGPAGTRSTGGGIRREDTTQFGQYTLPGGENYREVLLTLPLKLGKREAIFEKHKPGIEAAQRRLRDARGVDARDVAMSEIYRLEAIRDREADAAQPAPREGAVFRGGHYEEPNVLAHLRLNDRTDAQGKRVLFVEEIQSDWAQKGRREGFRADDRAQQRLVANPLKDASGQTYYEVRTEDGRFVTNVTGRRAGAEPLTPEYAIEEARQRLARPAEGAVGRAEGVPPAPFVGKTEAWTELALKRILRMAAEEGYDRVAWTTGEQQAARYDLSKQISRISWDDTAHILRAWDLKGQEVIEKHGLDPKELPDTIGKEATEKLLAQPGRSKEISGLDLKVGGEGMRGFYDKIVPQVAEKIGKKWGAKVGETQISSPAVDRFGGRAQVVSHDRRGNWFITDAETQERISSAFPTEEAALAAMEKAERASVHSIDITPEMRQSVSKEGFPLFAAEPRAPELGPAPAKPLTLDRVHSAFPGLRFTPSEDATTFTARLKDGTELRVTHAGEIEVPDRAALARSAAAAGVEGAAVPVGSYRRIGQDSLVWLAKEAPGGTLDHEAFHFAFDRALTDREKAATLKRYGDEEKAAYAYAEWTPKAAPNSWFSKILAFAKRIYRTFRPTWESVFEEVRAGRAGERISGAGARPEPPLILPGETAPGVTFAAAPAPAPAPVPEATPPPEARLREATLAEGGRVSAKPGGGADLESPINLDRLKTPDTVKQFFDRGTTALLPEIRKAKDYKSFAEIKAEADSLYGRGEYDEKALLKDHRSNAALTAAKITAARQMNVGAGKLLMEKARAYQDALKTNAPDLPKTEEALAGAVLHQQGILLATLGRSAEAARALAAHRIFVEGLTPEQRLFHKLAQRNGYLSEADLKAVSLAAASGDHTQLNNAIRKVISPSWFDKFFEVYVNGLISGPATMIANTASNIGMQAAGTVKRLLSAGVEQAVAKAQGRTPERFYSEVYSDMRGWRQGMGAALDPESPFNFVNAMKGLSPVLEEGKLEHRVGAIPGKAGEVFRLPGTILEASDLAAKGVSWFREANVRAERRARGEAKNQALDPTATEQYVLKRGDEIVQRVYKAFTDSTKAGEKYKGPFPEIAEAAFKAAKYDTFQKEAGPYMNLVNSLRMRDPTGLSRIIVPFFRTPANIAKVSIEHTPLKLFDIARKYRRGELRGGELADELAKPLFGALLAIPVAYMAKEGMLTGSGPTDPRERELWRATGAQPNSLVIPIDGKLHYIQYGRLEPIATLMSLVADFTEASEAKTRGDMADKIVGTILNRANDQTFLMGLSEFVLAAHDPKRYMGTLVKDTAGNLVPFSSLARATAKTIDPVVRDRTELLNSVLANLPGLSTLAPEKRTGTGEVIRRDLPALGALTPFATSVEKPGTELEKLLLDLDLHPSTPSRTLTIPGSHGRKVELTRDELTAFQEADRKATDKLRRDLRRGLAGLPPDQQRSYIERAYTDAARSVRERLYRDPDFKARAREALVKAKLEGARPASLGT